MQSFPLEPLSSREGFAPACFLAALFYHCTRGLGSSRCQHLDSFAAVSRAGFVATIFCLGLAEDAYRLVWRIEKSCRSVAIHTNSRGFPKLETDRALLSRV